MSTSDLTSTLDWRKASASGNNGCVELAPLPEGGVAVRDSKNPAGPVLSFTRHEWISFCDGMRKGEFTHLG
jgi:predicted secreted Zn-dependent protease